MKTFHIFAYNDSGHSWQQGMSFLCFKHPDVLALMPIYRGFGPDPYPPFDYPNIGPIEYWEHDNDRPASPTIIEWQESRPIHGYAYGEFWGKLAFSAMHKQFIKNGGMVFGNHFSNANAYIGPKDVPGFGYSCPPPHMTCAGGTLNWGSVNTWGPTLEITTNSRIGSWAQSFCAFTLAGYATVIWSYDWKMNPWDVRRYLRMGSTNYPNWSAKRGFGHFHVNLHGLTAYNDADLSPFGPAPFTQADVQRMMDSIMSREVSPVEPPVGIQINCPFFDADKWGPIVPLWYGWTVTVNPQPIFGYPTTQVTCVTEPTELPYPPWHYPGEILQNDLSKIDIRWVNFKSRNWKSTVITVDDQLIYEGQDEQFTWTPTTDKPFTMRFYSRATNGQLSREIDCATFQMNGLRPPIKYGSGTKRKKFERKIWIPSP